MLKRLTLPIGVLTVLLASAASFSDAGEKAAPDQPFHALARLGHRDAAWQVGHIGSKAGGPFLDHDQVFHVELPLRPD